MRTPTVIIIGALLALGVSACGSHTRHNGVASAGGTASATANATPTAQDEQRKALRFAQCMRDNGVPNFPDPKFNDNGGIGIDAPKGADPQKVQAAQEKCKQYLPGGGQPQKADPQLVEQLRKYSQCMRDHGITNFPDPTDQGLQVDNDKLGVTGPDDPRLTAASNACRQYMPGGPSGAATQQAGQG